MALVTVLILTYNHAKYVAQAIQSVITQQTTHRLRLVVLEDGSSDGTKNIVLDYAQRYPNIIDAVIHPDNVGRKKGIQSVVYEGFIKLDGDYIAVLEGDDYWSSPLKLEKQIAFLEENTDFVACAHNTMKVYEDGSTPHRFIYSEGLKPVHDIHDFVSMTSFFHISSLVFRNMHRKTRDHSFRYIQNRWCCDIYFNMAHVQFGKLMYFDEDMSVYRCHSGGNFSNMPEVKGRLFNIDGHRRFNYWLRYRYLKGFAFAIYRLCREMVILSDAGQLAGLSRVERFKYKALGELYGWIYDLIDAHPEIDPAVFWYREVRKASMPRQQLILGYDRALEQALNPLRPKPLVSIMLITYNHENFIAQALESILMQDTEYGYEINVIEDCSTDRTQEIVMEYVRRYPDKVKPYFNKTNIGLKVTQRNFFRGFKTLKGDYIAILEGDDYWSSPHKLQKQISFLEANSDYVGCAHNTIKVYEDGTKESHRFLYWDNMREANTVEDFIYLRAFFHTSTLMYRNVLKNRPPPQFENPWSCDIFITIAHAQFGKIRYFNEDMSVYRAHAGGRFSNMKLLDAWLFNLNGLRRYNAWLGYRYLKAFSGSIVCYCNVVLQGAGEEEGAAPLTLFQTIKYIAIRACYQSVFFVLDAKDRISAAYQKRVAKGSAIRVACLAPLYVLGFVGTALVGVLGVITGGLCRIVYTLLPERAKNLAKRAWCRFFPHEDIGHLRWLLKEGQLYSEKGAYHARACLRFYIAPVKQYAKRLLKAAW